MAGVTGFDDPEIHWSVVCQRTLSGAWFGYLCLANCTNWPKSACWRLKTNGCLHTPSRSLKRWGLPVQLKLAFRVSCSALFLPRFFQALRADSVAKDRVRVIAYVFFDSIPGFVLGAYLLACHANRKQAFQFFDATQVCVEIGHSGLRCLCSCLGYCRPYHCSLCQCLCLCFSLRLRHYFACCKCCILSFGGCFYSSSCSAFCRPACVLHMSLD